MVEKKKKSFPRKIGAEGNFLESCTLRGTPYWRGKFKKRDGTVVTYYVFIIKVLNISYLIHFTSFIGSLSNIHIFIHYHEIYQK